MFGKVEFSFVVPHRTDGAKSFRRNLASLYQFAETDDWLEVEDTKHIRQMGFIFPATDLVSVARLLWFCDLVLQYRVISPFLIA